MDKKNIIYEIAIAFLSVVVITLLIIETTCSLPQETIYIFSIIDTVVLIIFAVDYIVRFIKSERKWKFIKSNIIDLIAIIPFSSIFRAFRLIRLIRILRFAKLLRIAAFTGKFTKQLNGFLKTNNFNTVLNITGITILFGTLSIHLVEKMPIGNALWWTIVTTTTVGYGDISPTTGIGRIIAVILMIVGIGFISMLTGTIATFFIQKTQKSFRDETIESIKNKLDNFKDLSEADIDDMGRVLKALICENGLAKKTDTD